MDLAEALYEASANLPSDEKYGLVSQMKRSSVSIASNIAEGSGRGSNKDFARFMNIALGSAFELETQILLSSRLGFLTDSSNLLDKVTQIQKMLSSLIKKYQS